MPDQIDFVGDEDQRLRFPNLTNNFQRIFRDVKSILIVRRKNHDESIGSFIIRPIIPLKIFNFQNFHQKRKNEEKITKKQKPKKWKKQKNKKIKNLINIKFHEIQGWFQIVQNHVHPFQFNFGIVGFALKWIQIFGSFELLQEATFSGPISAEEKDPESFWCFMRKFLVPIPLQIRIVYWVWGC